MIHARLGNFKNAKYCKLRFTDIRDVSLEVDVLSCLSFLHTKIFDITCANKRVVI